MQTTYEKQATAPHTPEYVSEVSEVCTRYMCNEFCKVNDIELVVRTL